MFVLEIAVENDAARENMDFFFQVVVNLEFFMFSLIICYPLFWGNIR